MSTKKRKKRKVLAWMRSKRDDEIARLKAEVAKLEQLVSDNSATATNKHNDLTLAERRIVDLEAELARSVDAEIAVGERAVEAEDEIDGLQAVAQAVKQALPLIQHYERQLAASLSCDDRSHDDDREPRRLLRAVLEALNALEKKS